MEDNVPQMLLEVFNVFVLNLILDLDVKTVSQIFEFMKNYIDSYSLPLANPCASNPCGNNGQCRPMNGGFYCECDLGYFGNRCERKLKDIVACCWSTHEAWLLHDIRSCLYAESLHEWRHLWTTSEWGFLLQLSSWLWRTTLRISYVSLWKSLW